MGKFCFVCGKKARKYIDGKCKACYLKAVVKLAIPEKINILRCKKCGFYQIKNNWAPSDPKKIIMNHISLPEKGIKLDIKGGPIDFEVTADKKEKHKVKLMIKEIVCPVCARKFSDYYEAVLQIRGAYNDKTIEFIEDVLFKLSKKNRMAFYRFEKVPGGMDIKIGNRQTTTMAAEIIMNKYKCKVIKSYEMVGFKEGHELYRNVISLRF